MVFNPIPGWLNQVGFISNVFTNPCGARPSVYVHALLPAAARLFAVWVEPQPSDVVRGALRPRNAGMRTARHLRGGGRKGAGGIPDVGAAVGKWLGEAADIRPMVPSGRAGPLAQSFVQVWDAFEFTGLALLLVGGILEAGTFYTSMILDMSCDPGFPRTGPQRFREEVAILGLLGWQSWVDEDAYDPPAGSGWTSSSSIIGRTNGGFLTVLRATATNFNAHPCRFRFGFRDIDGPPGVQYPGDYVLLGPLESREVAWAAWRTFPGRMQTRAEAPDGNIRLNAVDFYATAHA